MQELNINVEDIIKDYADQVARLSSDAVFARAEKVAFIARIEELEKENSELLTGLSEVRASDRSNEVLEGELD